MDKRYLHSSKVAKGKQSRLGCGAAFGVAATKAVGGPILAAVAGLALLAGSCMASPVVGLSTVPAISVGEEHMLLLKTDGSVWSWGQNYLDRLGQGPAGATGALPKQVSGLSGMVSVAAGSSYSLALKADGTVWAWGNNADGVFGTGRGGNVPTQVPGLSSIIGIDVGSKYSAFAVDLVGNAWGWGYNGYANLGTGPSGSREDVLAPQRIAGLSNIVDLRAGGVSAAALSASGKAYTWGGFAFEPVSEVPGVSNAFAVSVDAVNTVHPHFALLTSGRVVAWGDTNSPAARCSQSSAVPAPADITGLSSIISVASGVGVDLFLDSDGQAWSCGGGSDGQQGDGTAMGTNNSPAALKVGPLRVVQGSTRFVSIATGSYASAAIAQDGSVWTWGRQTSYGLLGTGNLAASAPAVLAPAKIGVTAGDPTTAGPIFAGTQSAINSTTGASSIDIGQMFAPSHWQTVGKAYVVAILPDGAVYLRAADASWSQYDPAHELPASYTGTLSGMLPISLGTANWSVLAGTTFIVGYGLGVGAVADSEMLRSQRYGFVLTLR